MSTILEMYGHLGLDQTGMPGPLDAVGFADLSLAPSPEAVTGEGSRIIPGTRLVETASQKTLERLLATGEFGYGGSPFPHSIFTQDATQLPRVSQAEVEANEYVEKLANQLYYNVKSQEGKFHGYSGLGRFAATEGNQIHLEWKQFTQAVYIVPANQPRVKVWLVEGSGKEETVRAEGSSQALQNYFTVPLPTVGNIPLGQIWPEGTDKEVVIWCPATDEMWGMWRLAQFAEGAHAGEYKFGFGEYFPYVSKQTGIIKPQGPLLLPKEGWGARACGLAAVGGNITLEDLHRVLRGGKIGHAIGITGAVIKGPAAGAHLAPAVRNDTEENTFGTAETNPAHGTADAVPEGLWLAWPKASSASEFVNPATEPLAAAFYEAGREYGYFVNDKDGGSCGIQLNDPRVLGSPYAFPINPFAGYAGAEPKSTEVATYVNNHVPAGWTDATLPALKESFTNTKSIFSKMPWRNLEQLAPRTL